jgi:hypothetical protein
MVEYLKRIYPFDLLSINTPTSVFPFCRVNRPSETSSAKRAPELHNRSNFRAEENVLPFANSMEWWRNWMSLLTMVVVQLQYFDIAHLSHNSQTFAFSCFIF